jgi:hypothetical protein
MANALSNNRTFTPEQAYFLYTVWYGGANLTSFLRDTTCWSDLMTAARRLPVVLSEKGLRARVSALVLIQGEFGPAGRDHYACILSGFIDDVLEELKVQTGQERSPIAMLVQTNASNLQSATAVGVALAQWDVARSRPNDTVLLPAPASSQGDSCERCGNFVIPTTGELFAAEVGSKLDAAGA